MEFNELLQICRAGGTGVESDSRKIGPGDIFVAIHGENQDGAKYIPQAVAAGAKYVVYDACASSPIDVPATTLAIAHPDAREAVWRLAQARYRTDELPLRIIGVTGTNGKTTSAYLLERLFTAVGHTTGVLGTISYRWPGYSKPAPLTTPDPLDLHAMLRAMADADVDVAIMEVSSHSLAQRRVDGINFAGAIFTNLTRDHLDFHKDMESYFQAKSRLFFDLPQKNKVLAINADEEHGRRLLEKLPDALAFTLHGNHGNIKSLEGKILESGVHGARIAMKLGQREWELRTPLVGEFNVYNLLGVQALALELGLGIHDLKALETFPGVPGRLERVPNPRGLHVFVDYAHTPDALENALKALRGSGFRRLITVFGCGGNRDRTKRPLMGKAVADFSDMAVLTSDNPRFEDPEAIIKDVMPGLKAAGSLHVEADRRKATEIALAMMEKDDALLIAGKGHEDYQIIGGRRHHYSDQEVVREILNCE